MATRVLLADDSMTAQNMGKKILTDAGFDVVAVSNGAQALKKIAESNPDIVILDVYMPGYTGLEVCEKLRGQTNTASLPVLLTVGKMEPYREEDGAKVRADGVIIKPFEATDLIAVVSKMAEKSVAAAASAGTLAPVLPMPTPPQLATAPPTIKTHVESKAAETAPPMQDFTFDAHQPETNAAPAIESAEASVAEPPAEATSAIDIDSFAPAEAAHVAPMEIEALPQAPEAEASHIEPVAPLQEMSHAKEEPSSDIPYHLEGFLAEIPAIAAAEPAGPSAPVFDIGEFAHTPSPAWAVFDEPVDAPTDAIAHASLESSLQAPAHEVASLDDALFMEAHAPAEVATAIALDDMQDAPLGDPFGDLAESSASHDPAAFDLLEPEANAESAAFAEPLAEPQAAAMESISDVPVLETTASMATEDAPVGTAPDLERISGTTQSEESPLAVELDPLFTSDPLEAINAAPTAEPLVEEAAAHEEAFVIDDAHAASLHEGHEQPLHDAHSEQLAEAAAAEAHFARLLEAAALNATQEHLSMPLSDSSAFQSDAAHLTAVIAQPAPSASAGIDVQLISRVVSSVVERMLPEVLTLVLQQMEEERRKK